MTSVFSFSIVRPTVQTFAACGLLFGLVGSVLPAIAQDQPTAEAPAQQTAPLAATGEHVVPFARLGEASLQKALGLNEEQTTKIAELLKSRAEQAAAAKPEERDAVLNQNDAALQAVLTPEQVARLVSLTEPKIRFNFKHQRWSDVLEWFADEAGLSMVIDAPPAGTCNYRDSKEYTPAEAIDKMNSMLSPKDFTLIRRGRMLMVVDLSAGLPKELIPRVTEAELSQRGKYELVSILIPLGKRNGAEVEKEVKPLLGLLGEMALLPKTSQLLVIDQVRSIIEIQKLVKSIPEPAPPKKPAPKPPAPKPELKVYPADGFGAEAAMAILKELVKGAKFVADTEAKRLNAYATPAEHKAIEGVINQLKADNAPDKKAKLELYPFETEQPQQVLSSLALAIPGLQYRHDTIENQLVVFATPEEHIKLKEVLKTLSADQSPRSVNKQVQVYRLKNVELNAALQLLQQVLPKVRITSDTQQKAIIALATNEDHRVIKSMIAQLEETPSDDEQLKTYELKEAASATMLSTLQRMVPKATVTAEGKRLIVVASAADQVKVQQTIDKFPKLTKTPSRKLVIYKVEKSQNQRLQTVLSTITTEFPGIQVTPNAEKQEVSVWADPEQHELFANILNDLKKEDDDQKKNSLHSYELKSETPATVVSLLQTLFPETKIMLDASSSRLLVWSSETDQAEIGAALEKIDVAPRQTQQLKFYSLGALDSTTVITNLQQLLPAVRLSWDAETEQLLALASKTEHERLMGALEEWKSVQTAKANKQIQLFRLKRADPATAISTLQGLFKKTQFLVDPRTRGVIVIGEIADITSVKAVLDQLDQEEPHKEGAELQFHAVPKNFPANSITILQQMVPGAKISHDTENQRLAVIAKSKDQAKVKQNIQKVLDGATEKAKGSLRNYALSSVQRRRFDALVTALQQDYPGIRLLPETVPGELSLWATADQHEKLAELIEQVKNEVPPTEKQQLISYKLKVADPAETLAVLQSLFPDTKFVVESRSRSIMAWTRPVMQDVIKSSIEQIDSGKPGEFTQDFVILPLRNVNYSIAMSLLQETAPNAKITYDSSAGNFIVFGDEETKKLVAETLEKLQKETEAAKESENRVTKVYPGLEGRSGRDLVRLLRQMVPGASVESDRTTGNILAFAVLKEHAKIEKAIEQLKAQADAAEKPEAATIRLKKTNANDVRRLLSDAIPDVEIRNSADNMSIMVVARPTQLKLIQEIVDKLEQGEVEAGVEVRVYSLNRMPASSAGQTMSMEFPKLKYSNSGVNPYNMIVWGTPEEHEQYAAFLKKVDEEWNPNLNASMKIYNLENITANMVVPVIQQSVSRATFSPSGSNNRLVVWAPDAAHEEVQAIITQMEEVGPVDADSVMKVYQLETTTSSALTSAIQTAVPTVRFVSSSDQFKLILFATEKQHEKIAKIVSEIEKQNSPTYGGELKIYSLKKVPASTAQSVVVAAIPNLRFGTSPSADKMVVWATKAAHGEIQKIVDQLEADGPPEKDTVLKVYRMKSTISASVTPIIQAEVPTARFGYSPNQYKMIIWATTEQHDKIVKIVDQIDSEQTATNGGVLKVHQLEVVPASTAQSIIQSVYPNVKFGPSPDGKKLVIWASEDQHVDIKKIVDELESSTGDKDASLISYSVEATGSTYAYQVLVNAVPGVRISYSQDPGRIHVWCTPAMHEKVKQIVEKLEAEGPPAKDAYVETYLFKKMPASNALSVLQMSVPTARFTNTNDTRKLIVWAKPLEHQALKTIIEKLETEVGEDDDRVLAVLPLNKVSHTTLMQFLKPELIANANLTPNTATDNLVVQAPKEQMEELKAAIAELVEKLPKNEKRVSELYRFKYAEPASARTILRSLVPAANIVVDRRTRSLMISALPEEHEILAAAITKMDANVDSESAAVLKHYQIKNIDTRSMMSMLQTLFSWKSEVRFTMDANTKTIVAYATAEQHEEIASFITDLDQQTTGQISKVYPVRNITPNSAFTVVRGIFPRATLVINSTTSSLVVVATEAEHQKVAKTIAEIDVENVELGRHVKVYTMAKVDPSTMVGMLRNLFRSRSDVTFSVDSRAGTIIVNAPNEQHEKIALAIEDVEASNGTFQTKLFSSKKVSANSLLQMLQSQYSRHNDVRMSLDSQSGMVMIFATEEKLKQIEETVATIESTIVPKESKVYRLTGMDARSAYSVIQNMLTHVQVTFDSTGNSVIVSASKEDQETVAKLIEELESSQPSTEEKRVSRAYQSDSISTRSLYRMVNNLFQGKRAVSVTQDAASEMVMVYAEPQDHEKAEQLIAELERSTSASETSVYRLKHAQPGTARTALLAISPKAKIGLDTGNQSLIVNASAADHQKIKETLAMLDVDPHSNKKLEIFTLEVNEAYEAETAVERFFGNAIWDDDPNAPLIDSDLNNQQLVVRGSEKQIQQIREFLIKKGETQLAYAAEDKTKKKNLRVIPFRGNSREAIEELQRLWPQLRKNRIKVVVPSAVAPTMRKYRKINEPKGAGVNFSVKDNAGKPGDKKEGATKPSTSEPAVSEQELSEEEEFRKLVEKAKKKLAEQAVEFDKPKSGIQADKASENSFPEAAPQLPVKSEEGNSDATLKPNSEENIEVGSDLPPIIISPTDGSITVTSDDPEALDQIENLLRAMSRSQSRQSVGKDFVVFSLQNASATNVQRTLNNMFNGNRRNRGRGGFSAFSSVSIQADERLNSIIVYGNKKERDRVEELLQVLDSDETPELLDMNKPKVITIQHTSAVRIEAVLRDIYRSELRSAGGARPIPVPTGVSREVAATIQQINITMAGPLLHITVDGETNSIIVSGAEKLVEQVEALIAELDEKAKTESTQTFRVVPLKKINSNRAREVLRELFPQQRRRGRRRR